MPQLSYRRKPQPIETYIPAICHTPCVCDCTLPCDLSSITISVSDHRLFYDIRVSQGSVATRMRCGVISNYNFTPNLPLSQSTEEFWHRFGVFLFVEHSVNNTTILINGIILCFMFYYMLLHLLHNIMPGGDLRVIYCCRDRGTRCMRWTDGTRAGRRQWNGRLFLTTAATDTSIIFDADYCSKRTEWRRYCMI